MSNFDKAFEVVVQNEGGFSKSPLDSGNWTEGGVGKGELRGTKFGISAAAYPKLDISSLTLDEVRGIYRSDYWAPIGAENLPRRLSLVVFDAAVNNGVRRAVKWLQQVCNVLPLDGVVGPRTLGSVQSLSQSRNGEIQLCAEYQALRLIFMVRSPGWRDFGPGWARRLCLLPYQSDSVENQEIS